MLQIIKKGNGPANGNNKKMIHVFVAVVGWRCWWAFPWGI